MLPEVTGRGSRPSARSRAATVRATAAGAFPWPILVVQHIRQGWRFDGPAMFHDSLHAPLPVHEAEDKQVPEPGCIYFAPAGYHLHVEDDRTLALSVDPPVNWARPSIDVTFESVARAYGGDATGADRVFRETGAPCPGRALLQLPRPREAES